MVVVATGSEEQRSRIVPDGTIEAKRIREEGGGLCDVPHVQVHVADGGPGGHPDPRLAAGRGDEAGHVDRIGRHHQFAPHSPPALARTIRIHLDAEVVRILEVEGLAHEVIAGARTRTDLAKVAHEAAERWTVGEENGEVVEPETAAPRRRPRSFTGTKLDERPIVTVSREHGAMLVAMHCPEAERALVELQRSLEVRDPQRHRTDVRAIGKPVAHGRLAIRSRLSRFSAYVSAENVAS